MLLKMYRIYRLALQKTNNNSYWAVLYLRKLRTKRWMPVQERESRETLQMSLETGSIQSRPQSSWLNPSRLTMSEGTQADDPGEATQRLSCRHLMGNSPQSNRSTTSVLSLHRSLERNPALQKGSSTMALWQVVAVPCLPGHAG